MVTHIAYDTEFAEDGSTIELISIGLVANNGRNDGSGYREYYAVNADMDQFKVQRRDWLLENVWPQLPTVEREPDPNRRAPWPERHQTKLDLAAACVKPKWVIANEVRDFILHGYDPHDMTKWGGDLIATLSTHIPPKLWAYYGAYDHVALAQLFGQMIDLPKGIPMFTHEIMQLLEENPIELPKQASGLHNALQDARWNMKILLDAGVFPNYEPPKEQPA